VLFRSAQTAQGAGEGPPIAQPLVREGDLAVRLVDAFQLGPASGEVEAETLLGNAGVTPRNGWIADYPVTPDVIGELSQSINDAADANLLKMKKTDALQAFHDVTQGMNIPVKGGAPGQTPQKGPGTTTAPNTTVINNYYNDQGPPVVTYYPPPPSYVYLYSFVPYPFWGWDLWFPGYYILVDFHRVAHVHDRRDRDRRDHDRRDHDRVEVISNHYVDHRTNRIYRIDPLSRFNGRTFAGIGAPRDNRRYVSPGVKGGSETIYRGYRDRTMSEGGREHRSPNRQERDEGQRTREERTGQQERR
jgi:hypothetical protein